MTKAPWQIVTIGDTIEDETGWWIVTGVGYDEIAIMDRHGTEKFISPGNLGPVTKAAA